MKQRIVQLATPDCNNLLCFLLMFRVVEAFELLLLLLLLIVVVVFRFILVFFGIDVLLCAGN